MSGTMQIPGDVEQDRHGPFLHGPEDKQEEQTSKEGTDKPSCVRDAAGPWSRETKPNLGSEKHLEDRTFKLRCRNESQLGQDGVSEWRGAKKRKSIPS